MFHVKHPDEVAAQVRSRLERFMLTTRPSCLSAKFIDRMVRFASLLTLWGARFNLTAEPGNPDELAFHIIDSVMPLAIISREESPLADAFRPDARVLDLGSGAGFPGLVLAAASGAHFRLVESRRKRVSFLNAAAHTMGLLNVTIDSGRRTATDFQSDFDTVTARAFGPPQEFYRIAASALRPKGIAVLYANPQQPLMPEAAQNAGLTGQEQIPYEVARGRTITPRILAIWRKA